MSYEQYNNVVEFHRTFGHPIETERCPDKIFDVKLIKLRIDLIEEEIIETEKAIANNDLHEIIDGLCDIQYVTLGAQIVLGIEFSPIRIQGIKTLREGLNELKLAAGNFNFQGFVLSLMIIQKAIDCLVMKHGLTGIFDQAFEEVHNSNMTKVCDSEQQALSDKEYRELEGINVTIEKIGRYWVLKNKDTLKVVKAVNWREPNFENLIKLIQYDDSTDEDY